MPSAPVIEAELLSRIEPPAGYSPIEPIRARVQTDKEPSDPSPIQRIADLESIGTVTGKGPARSIAEASLSYSDSTGQLVLSVKQKGNSYGSPGDISSEIKGAAEIKLLIDCGRLTSQQKCDLRVAITEILGSKSAGNSAVERGDSILNHRIFELPQLAGKIRYIEGSKFNISGKNLAGVQFGSLEDVKINGNSNLDGATFTGSWSNVEIDGCTLRYARMGIECTKATNEDRRNRILGCNAEGLDLQHSILNDLRVGNTNVIGADFSHSAWEAKDLMADADPAKHKEARARYFDQILYAEDSTRFFADDGKNSEFMAKLHAISYVDTAPPEMSVEELRKSISSGAMIGLSNRFKKDAPHLVEIDAGEKESKAAAVGPVDTNIPGGKIIKNAAVRFTFEPATPGLIAKIAEFKPGEAAGTTATTPDGTTFTVKAIGEAWGVVARFVHAAIDEELRMWSEAFKKAGTKPPPAKPAGGKTTTEPVPPDSGDHPSPDPGKKAPDPAKKPADAPPVAEARKARRAGEPPAL